MTEAHDDTSTQPFEAPPEVVGISIDPESGKRATPYCDTSRVMYFEKGTEPEKYCDIHMPDGEEPGGHDDGSQKKEEQGFLEKIMDSLF